MIRRITLPRTESNFEQVVRLDGADFVLRFLWNERSGHWFLTVRDATGTDLLTGVKLVAWAPLCPHDLNPLLPPGELWCVRPGGDSDPGLNDLDSATMLLYVEEATVA